MQPPPDAAPVLLAEKMPLTYGLSALGHCCDSEAGKDVSTTEGQGVCVLLEPHVKSLLSHPPWNNLTQHFPSPVLDPETLGM